MSLRLEDVSRYITIRSHNATCKVACSAFAEKGSKHIAVFPQGP